MLDKLLSPVRTEGGFIFAVFLGFLVGMIIVELVYPIISNALQ